MTINRNKLQILLVLLVSLQDFTSVQGFSQLPLRKTSLVTSRLASRNHMPRDIQKTFHNQRLHFTVTNNYQTRESSKLYNDAINGEIDYTTLKPKVYPKRWVQLAYLSLLALLSDWICFSVAAAPSTFETAYAGHSAASLIDIFLFTNVASCFIVTDTVSKFGLEKAIKGAAALMATGCFLRSGLSFLNPLLSTLGLAVATTADSTAGAVGLVPYWSIVAGTVLVGAAQPFFQCTPPMLSATWFASNERATSTAVALNFNQIGIATAFLIGGGMATSTEGLGQYFSLITVACTAVMIGTFLQFEEKPPTPPSRYVYCNLFEDIYKLIYFL